MESFDGFEFGGAYKGEPVEEIGGVLLPEDYLAFMREHNGGEGEVGGTYLVLFPLEELSVVYDNYDLGRVLPGYVVIGGDGGGELYCVDENGRYYNVPAMIDKEDLTCLGDNFKDFIKNAVALWKGDD